MNIGQALPKWLFGLTIAVALVSTIISVHYARKVSELTRQSVVLSELRKQYEQRVRELQSKLIVQKTVSVNIPSPQVKEQCQTIFLGNRICVPVTTFEQHEVKQTVNVEDPQVRQELDDALGKLKELSKAATAADTSVTDFQPYYELVQKMMKPFISILVCFSGIYIILSGKYNGDRKVGFWSTRHNTRFLAKVDYTC